MRILHLIHSEGVYGAELILLYLAREQQKRGHEPLVGSIRDPGTERTSFEALANSWGLPVIPIRIAPRPTPEVIRSLLRIVRDVAPAVLHSHGYKANILLAPVPRRRRGAMLATRHGWTNTRRFSRMWLYEHLDRLALRRLDSVVVVARHMLKLPAVQGIPAFRLHVIENGIPRLRRDLRTFTGQGVALLPACAGGVHGPPAYAGHHREAVAREGFRAAAGGVRAGARADGGCASAADCRRGARARAARGSHWNACCACPGRSISGAVAMDGADRLLLERA